MDRDRECNRGQFRVVPQIKKIRVCLKCLVEFVSTGAGNRLCAKCNGENSRVYDMASCRFVGEQPTN